MKPRRFAPLWLLLMGIALGALLYAAYLGIGMLP